jgi:hypothetical protein
MKLDQTDYNFTKLTSSTNLFYPKIPSSPLSVNSSNTHYNPTPPPSKKKKNTSSKNKKLKNPKKKIWMGGSESTCLRVQPKADGECLRELRTDNKLKPPLQPVILPL